MNDKKISVNRASVGVHASACRRELVRAFQAHNTLKRELQRLCFTFLSSIFLSAPRTDAANPPDGPIVPEGFEVELIAREPLVRNPTVMTFDRRGRLFVGQGPQWRAPSPDTEGDHVDLLIDDDGDGVYDRVKRFAEGFNSIQGIVWWGDELWIANAPDLTMVRDLDGDDEADEYVRVYTGLGNLEHSLHGLNVGPDGKLYMSKGNSKGYNRPDQLAPKPFRELWGLPDPKGAVDFPPVEVFKKGEYQKKYHTPPDDWGRMGGILRCDKLGRNLEIVARGFRNPWDITFDDGFNWLGTDNDQVQGDKIFMPFHGGHFGWGHGWSYHWTGAGHLPTVPMSAPLFEGSGAGIIHYHAGQFPKEYRGVYFINDWMRREVYVFRPEWRGALQVAAGGKPGVFAKAGTGRTIPGSSGRAFDPTDIEVAPDGSLIIASWGRGYGATMKDGQQVDEGRIYRISWGKGGGTAPPITSTIAGLIKDLGSHMSARRVDAQTELIKRGRAAKQPLLHALTNDSIAKAQETWVAWTLGLLAVGDRSVDQFFAGKLGDKTESLNLRVQSARILAHRSRERGGLASSSQGKGRTNFRWSPVLAALKDPEPRIRVEAVQAIWRASQKRLGKSVVNLTASESDRVTFHVAWKSLRDLLSVSERKALLKDRRPGVKLAALLGLFEDDRITGAEAEPFRLDPDQRIASLVESWLEKTGNSDTPLITMDPPPGVYPGPVKVKLSTIVPSGRLHYTTDGNPAENTAPRYQRPITIDSDATLRVAVTKHYQKVGKMFTGRYEIRPPAAYAQRPFISDVRAASKRHYEMDWTGLAPGKYHYTDRDYRITGVPEQFFGAPFLRTANNDDRSVGDRLVSLRTDSEVDVYLGLDKRVPKPMSWMRVGEPDGFQATDIELATTDPAFRFYRKTFPAGQIVLGGGMDHRRESGRGHYIAVFDRSLVKASEQPATVGEALAKMKRADVSRGRDLFHQAKGAGCFNCHQLEGHGNVFAPDLSDIGSRADAKTLLESIIHPSKEITEGFAQQVIETKDEFTYSGIVLEESGRIVRMALANGQAVNVKKSDIARRDTAKLSAMPEGFANMMTAQQLAHLTAYLLAQKSVSDKDGFSFRKQQNELEIHFGEQRIATYLLDHPQLTRRAFVNVRTPSGIQVTRNWPVRKPEDIDPGYRGEDGIIHPIMHPGLWMGFGWIDGHDYWRLKAKVVHDDFIEEPAGDKTAASFTVRNRYLSQDGKRTVCLETCRFNFKRVPEGIRLDWDSTFKSDEHDFVFGDQEESGLAIRVAAPIRVQGGNGTITNDRGEKNGAGTWGKPLRWIDYSGSINGKWVGIKVTPHPENPRACWAHSRDYGVVVVNPFPKQPRERRRPYVTTPVKKREEFRLRYSVLIHEKQP